MVLNVTLCPEFNVLLPGLEVFGDVLPLVAIDIMHMKNNFLFVFTPRLFRNSMI